MSGKITVGLSEKTHASTRGSKPQESNIFGIDPPSYMGGPAHDAHYDNYPAHHTATNDLSKPQASAQAPARQDAAGVGEPRAVRNLHHTGYNPITGETTAYQKPNNTGEEDPNMAVHINEPAHDFKQDPHGQHSKANPVHTSSRVLQPPGGGANTRPW